MCEDYEGEGYRYSYAPFTVFTIYYRKRIKSERFSGFYFSSHVEGRYPQEYKYTAFLPDFAVWINGWEKKWTEGERTVYQKGERTVNVFHPPGDDGYYLYEEGEYAK